MEKLLQSLHEDIVVNRALTGTIYVSYNYKKIRISNHEPRQFTGNRISADLLIYTHDITGKEINSKYEVVEKIADFLNLKIPGPVKGAITRHNNKKKAEAQKLRELMRKNELSMKVLQLKKALFHLRIWNVIKGKEKQLKQLLKEAAEYGDLGSNGSKRKKRRVSFFKREFKNRFGITATPNDVAIAIKKFNPN